MDSSNPRLPRHTGPYFPSKQGPHPGTQEQVAPALGAPRRSGGGQGKGVVPRARSPASLRSQAAQAKQGLWQRQWPGLVVISRPPVLLPACEGPEMGLETTPCPSHRRARRRRCTKAAGTRSTGGVLSGRPGAGPGRPGQLNCSSCRPGSPWGTDSLLSQQRRGSGSRTSRDHQACPTSPSGTSTLIGQCLGHAIG